MINLNNIKEKLDSYQGCKLECDGYTKVASHLLTEAGFYHFCFVGSVTYKRQTIKPHMWIELMTGEILDYATQMWLGPNVPQGIFWAKDFPELIYKSRTITKLGLMPESLFEILTTPWEI